MEGWNLINEDGKLKLNRSWKVTSFVKGLELFKLVGDVAESEGCHSEPFFPLIFLCYIYLFLKRMSVKT